MNKFKNHIDQNLPFLKGKKLLLAVSGGIDSMVLTAIFHSLNYDISLAHCNFNLRGTESDKDESFVQNVGQKLAIKTFCSCFDTKSYAQENKISTQIAARDLRYKWFKELSAKNKFDYILTAHHLDDNLETFIINLTRGTGLDGLTGIPVVNNKIIRPLLNFSRNEIESYANQNQIEWREDQSNSTTKYTRNKIRHQIVPILKEINPSLLSSFQKTITNLKGSQEIINDTVSNLKKEAFTTTNEYIKIKISVIKQIPNYKPYLFEILKEFEFTEWNDVNHLLESQSGKFVLSKTHRLLKDREFLYVTKINAGESKKEFLISKTNSSFTFPIRITLKSVLKTSEESLSSIFIDENTITFPLTLRKWLPGDYFYPKGMKGKKKLGKYFKDEKYSLIDKETTWVLTSGDNIIWIIGKRQDQRFMVSHNTKKITNIKISQ